MLLYYTSDLPHFASYLPAAEDEDLKYIKIWITKSYLETWLILCARLQDAGGAWHMVHFSLGSALYYGPVVVEYRT